MSSPFLFVFGDDRVTCHTGVDDITGDVADAYRWRGSQLGILSKELIYVFRYLYWILEFVITLLLLLNKF